MTAADVMLEVMRIYQGSDGERTKALYVRLGLLGSVGTVAVNLFRAQKASERAKVYRGGGYRGIAYDKKQWSIDQLCAALQTEAAPLGLVWGWGLDEKQPVHRHVLYVELPTGQVSFHSGVRGPGPDYALGWDGMPGQAPDRITRWIGRLLAGATTQGETADA